MHTPINWRYFMFLDSIQQTQLDVIRDEWSGVLDDFGGQFSIERANMMAESNAECEFFTEDAITDDAISAPINVGSW